MSDRDNEPRLIRFQPEHVTAILVNGAPNWEYIVEGSFEQEEVSFSETYDQLCFYADSLVTEDRIFGFVENLMGLRYRDPDNPRPQVTHIKDDRVLP